MQNDGNLCLYMMLPHQKCVWASNTHGKGQAPHRLIMQDDGNLVIYDANNHPTWDSKTNEKGGDFTFYIQYDGNMVIENPMRQIIWQSGVTVP